MNSPTLRLARLRYHLQSAALAFDFPRKPYDREQAAFGVICTRDTPRAVRRSLRASEHHA